MRREKRADHPKKTPEATQFFLNQMSSPSLKDSVQNSDAKTMLMMSTRMKGEPEIECEDEVSS